MYTGIYILLTFNWRIKLRNLLRIEGEKYLREKFIALCDYKDIVWIALQTNTNFSQTRHKIWVI